MAAIKEPETVEQLFTIKQIAERLGMSEGFLRDQVLKRRIKHLKIGGSIRFKASHATEYLEKCEREVIG